MWPTPPKKLKIPKCACGGKRVFEMQVLPSVLLNLGVDELADATASKAREAEEERKESSSAGTEGTLGSDISDIGSTSKPAVPAALKGKGMDFGSLMVFCCENCCDMSCEEYIVECTPY